MQAELIINNICNLSCKHCFQGQVELCGAELRQHEWISTIDKLTPHVDHFHFAGKEPLYNDSIFELMNHIPADKTFSLVTNGITIPKYGHLLTAYPNLTDIGVSIDSFMGDDSVRPFNEAFNIKMLTSLGLPVTTYLTLTSRNYKNLIKNIEVLQQAGVKRFWIIPVLALGSTPRELILSPKQLTDTIRLFEKNVLFGEFNIDIKGGYAEVLSYESFKFKTPLKWSVELSCEKFIDRIVITPDGEVLGCGFEYSNGYFKRSSGNILLDSVEDLLVAGERSKWNNIDFATKCKEVSNCKFCNNLCPLMNYCYKNGVEKWI